MRVVAVAVTCLVASGCDEIWDLEYIEAPPGCPSPIGHDEDDDNADDACDICPGISDLQTADRDDDGVGDACDPTPAVAGDSKFLFYAFATQTDREQWFTSVDWLVDADALVHVDLTPADGSYTKLLDPPPPVPFEIQVGLTLDGVDRSNPAQLTLYGNHGAGAACSFFHGGPPGNSNVWEAVPAPLTRVSLPAAYNAGTSYVARIRVTGAEITCQLDGQTASGSPLMGTSAAALSSPAPGNVAVITTNTQLRFHWFAIYKLP